MLEVLLECQSESRGRQPLSIYGQATVGVRTVLMWHLCVARTRGGGGYLLSLSFASSILRSVLLRLPAFSLFPFPFSTGIDGPPLHHYPPPPFVLATPLSKLQ